jgi:hypothetical protein
MGKAELVTLVMVRDKLEMELTMKLWRINNFRISSFTVIEKIIDYAHKKTST